MVFAGLFSALVKIISPSYTIAAQNFDVGNELYSWASANRNLPQNPAQLYDTFTLTGSTYTFANGDYTLTVSDMSTYVQTNGNYLNEVLRSSSDPTNSDYLGGYAGFDWPTLANYSSGQATSSHPISTTATNNTTYYGSYIQLSLPYSLILKEIQARCQHDNANNPVNGVVLLGSNDNGTTFDLIVQSNFPSTVQTQIETITPTISNTTAYALIRMVITSFHGTGGTAVLDYFNLIGDVILKEFYERTVDLGTISSGYAQYIETSFQYGGSSSNYPAYRAVGEYTFNNVVWYDNSSSWSTYQNPNYVTVSGNIKTTNNNISTTLGGTSVNGDWLTIDLQTQETLAAFHITLFPGIYWETLTAQGNVLKIYVAGSNDNSAWTQLGYFNHTSALPAINASPTWSTILNSTILTNGTIPDYFQHISNSTIKNENLLERTSDLLYLTSLGSYRYYRFIFTEVYINAAISNIRLFKYYTSHSDVAFTSSNASASSVGNYLGFYYTADLAFNNNDTQQDSYISNWQSTSNEYDQTSPFAYTGSNSTTVDNNTINGEWLQMDFGSMTTKYISKHTIATFNDWDDVNTGYMPEFMIAGSEDGSTWTEIGTYDQGLINKSSTLSYFSVEFDSTYIVRSRYIRLIGIRVDTNMAIREWQMKELV